MPLYLSSCCLFDLDCPFSSYSPGVSTHLSGFGSNVLSHQDFRESWLLYPGYGFLISAVMFIPHVVCTLFEGRGIIIPLLTPWEMSITMWMLGVHGTSCLSFFFFSFFFLILWCTQKAYYPNVNSIAFVAFFQTGWGNKAWIRNFMRDSLPPNNWIGYRFCIMVLTSLNHSVTGK